MRKIVDDEEHFIEKKQSIMPSEYFKLLDHKDPTKKTLKVNRVVMIDYNMYYTLDFYPEVNG